MERGERREGKRKGGGEGGWAPKLFRSGGPMREEGREVCAFYPATSAQPSPEHLISCPADERTNRAQPKSQRHTQRGGKDSSRSSHVDVCSACLSCLSLSSRISLSFPQTHAQKRSVWRSLFREEEEEDRNRIFMNATFCLLLLQELKWVSEYVTLPSQQLGH